MSLFFLDSNIIIKYYYTEPGSTWVRHLVDDQSNACLISEIAVPEVAAALSQLHHHKHFGRRFLNETFQQFEEAIIEGKFLNQILTTETLAQAARLALSHVIKGYDAVQVSAALTVQQKVKQKPIFISGDKQVVHLAKTVGFSVETPFDHILPEDQQR